MTIRSRYIYALTCAGVMSTVGIVWACLQPPGYGYIVRSVFEDDTRLFPVISNQRNQVLGGNFDSPDFGAAGSTTSWQASTDSNGLTSAGLGKSTPAKWKIFDITGYCSPADPYAVNTQHYELIDFQPSSTPQSHYCYRIAIPVGGNPRNLLANVSTSVSICCMSGSPTEPVTWEAYTPSGTWLGSGGYTSDDGNTYWCQMQIPWYNDGGDPPGTDPSFIALLVDSSSVAVGKAYMNVQQY